MIASKKRMLSVFVAAFFSLHSSLSYGISAQARQREKASIVNQVLDKVAIDIAVQKTTAEYNMHRNTKTFSESFLRYFNARDKAQIAKLLNRDAELPELQRDGQTLIFKNDHGSSVKVVMLPGETKKFRVNGSLWTYDPSTPLIEQVDLLNRNHPPSRGASLWMNILLPKAHAEPLSVAIITVAIITSLVVGISVDSIKKMLENQICSATLGLGAKPWHFQPRNGGFCADWDAIYQSKNSNRPKLDALEQLIASDKSNVLTKFKTDKDFSCPSNNDAKDRVYETDVIVASTGAKIKIKINFTPQGKVKDYKVFDTKNGAEIGKIDFETDGRMKCATVPDSAPSSAMKATAALQPSTLSLCSTNTNLNPQQRGLLETLEDSVKFVNLMVAKCTVQAVSDKILLGQIADVGSPANPKANDTALQVPSRPTLQSPDAKGAAPVPGAQ